MNPTTLAYLAGYFDGDGCITYVQLKTRLSALYVKVSSGDKETLQLFARTFGGKVIPVAKHLSSSKRKQFYWYRSGATAQRILSAMLPYLVTKRAIAELALRPTFSYTKGRAKLSNRELLLRKKVATAIHKINTRITREDYVS